jgi:hypothetical protein
MATTVQDATKPKTLIEAITEAMYEEMEADERVFCIGEDIGFYGGVFKATKGLWEKFGAERVIDSPLSESMIVGASIGAASSACARSPRSSSRTSSPAASTRSSSRRRACVIAPAAAGRARS